MKRRGPVALPLAFALTAAAPRGPVSALQEVTRTVGQLTVTVDVRDAYPGGMLTARLRSRIPMGAVFAILEGRRAPFLMTRSGPMALLPLLVTAAPGTTTLGIEVMARSGRQRIPIEVPVAPREYRPRSRPVPESKRFLFTRPGSLRDGRHLLLALRSETPGAHWVGPFLPPVSAPPSAPFGTPDQPPDAMPIEMMSDALAGEYHRGVDYDVPGGTVVQAPNAGTVALSQPLTLTGQTLVLDHGEGVVSAFFHLSRIDVQEGERVEARAPLALSGDTGLAASPHLHWGVYVHGVAVDPKVLELLPE